MLLVQEKLQLQKGDANVIYVCRLSKTEYPKLGHHFQSCIPTDSKATFLNRTRADLDCILKDVASDHSLFISINNRETSETFKPFIKKWIWMITSLHTLLQVATFRFFFVLSLGPAATTFTNFISIFSKSSRES